MKVALRRGRSPGQPASPRRRNRHRRNRLPAQRPDGPLAHSQHRQPPGPRRPANMAPTASSKSRSAIHEFDLIRTLQQRHSRHDPSVIRGIGDDAAIVTSGAGKWSLLTTDLLAEGIHFDLRTATMADIGFRAAVANLSDIAAMGGTPQYLLVSLAIPRSGASNQVHQLYKGMMAACRPHRVTLIGGDTSASANGWFINITLVGMVPPRKALLRSGARTGDLLYVTGTIGDALAGLMLLNEQPGKTRRPHDGALGQTQAIPDRQTPASDRTSRGRPMAQCPSRRDFRYRCIGRPVRRSPPYLRRKPCRRRP